MEGNKVFVDSNVLIGLFNKDDALHEKSAALWDVFKNGNYRIVVSNFVISEVITVLSQKAGKDLALEFALTMYEAPEREVEIIRLTEQEERRALEHFKAISSKNVSFVDATIFAVTELHEITKLASFDNVFKQRPGRVELFS